MVTLKEKHPMSIHAIPAASQSQAATIAALSKGAAQSRSAQPAQPQDTVTISAAAKSQQTQAAVGTKETTASAASNKSSASGDADHDGH
jgi:hypothetical protein